MPADFLTQLLNLPTVWFAKPSPDGRWVAFVWYHAHENMDVFLVPTDDSAAPIALTHTPEYTWLVDWTPDSKAVIVNQDHERDEHVRLFRVDIDRPEVMIPLTEDRPPYFLRGGALHPDGRKLFYMMNYDAEAGKAIEATWVYRHDLETGERVPIARPAKPAYSRAALNKAGTHLIYGRKDRHPSGVQFHLVDVDGKHDEELLNFGDAFKTFARWLPDNEHVAFTTESKDGTAQPHISLGLMHLPTRKIRWLVDDPQRDLEAFWVTQDGLIVVDEVRQSGHYPTFINPESGEERPFPRLPGNLVPIGRAADGAWVGVYYAANWPTEVVRFNLDARSIEDLTFLTRVWERTDVKPEQLYAAESITWKSDDGMEVQGWLYRARPNPKRAIVYVHGGPTYHTEDRLNPQVQYLVSAGFNVLDVNYRGSTGFGLGYKEAIKIDGWGGREQEDIAMGAKKLIEMGLAEPGRIGVTGTSYGGYSSWVQITRQPPEVIAAAAPVCGMTDLVVDYETTRPDLRPYSEEMIGGSPQQIPEKYHERSPIHFVQDIRGKLLIVQGGQDPNVTPENVRQVIMQLHQHDILYELLEFPDEGHGIYRPANQARLYKRMAEFFAEALGSHPPHPAP